jgi:hypothetical protein
MTLLESEEEWEIACDRETFQRVRREAKFPYIVALARAVNAMNSIHSLLRRPPGPETPERVRNGINSYFFASALLYEGLILIRKMNSTFANDETFQGGLRMLLKDPVAQMVERDHLNSARNHVVFHFLPDEFKKAIDKSADDRQVFITGIGEKKGDLHYSYADTLAAEVIAGTSNDDPKFWSTFENAARDTSELLITFADEAEELIANYLGAWGFKREGTT